MDNVFKAMGVRLMQRVDAAIAATLPRQAFVTRSEGSHVFVRFAGESSSAPESQFPSTMAGLPAGTMGWVITLGGNKGLFVATGIAMPQSIVGGGYDPQTISTTGYVTIGGPAVVSGLIPFSTVQVTTWTVLRVSTNTSGMAHAGSLITSNSGQSTHQSDWIKLGADAIMMTHLRRARVVVPASGEISASAILVWRSGSVSASNSQIMLTVTG